MMRTTKGFTLIELLIAIAIIGILATIALSTFRDYSIRAKVSEGLSLSHAVKLAVSETYDSEGRFLSASNASYGLPLSTSIVSKYVSSVAVGVSGMITITYSDQVGGIPTANNRTILLNPTPQQGNMRWDCTGGNQLSKYRPAECRP